MFNRLFISNIILHVMLMSIFLNIFYFTYAKSAEKEVLYDQIDILVQELINNISGEMNSTEKEALKLLIESEIKKINLDKEDSIVNSNNGELEKTAIIATVIGVGICLFLLFLLLKDCSNLMCSLRYLAISGGVGILFTALAEIFFINVIVKNYISVDSSLVITNIIDTLYKNRCTTGQTTCIPKN